MPEAKRRDRRSRPPLSEEDSRDYVMKRTDWMDDKSCSIQNSTKTLQTNKLNLKDTTMFTELTGLEYLKAEIACKHDKAFEKETWADRLAHFETLDLTSSKIFKQSSNPIGLRAAIKAYQDTAANIPTGYMISLDATSSGMQILSLLVSCPTSFNLCGGNSDECVDSYTTIYDSMNLHGALTRKQVKAAIMTLTI